MTFLRSAIRKLKVPGAAWLGVAGAGTLLVLSAPEPAALVGAGLALSSLLVFLMADPERTFLAMVFCLPIWGVGRLEAGVTVTLSKMFAALLILQLGIRRCQTARPLRTPWAPPDRFLAGFWVYCLTVSLLSLFTLDRVVPLLGFQLRGPGLRFVSQLGVLLLMAGVYFGTRVMVRDGRMLRRTVWAMLLSFGLSSAYGIYQFVGYMKGWPLTDLRQGGTAISRVGIFFGMTRISSLAGEPKGLALTMLPVIVMLLGLQGAGNPRWGRGRRNTLFLLLLLTAFVGTFSRAGYVLLPVCLLALPLFRGWKGTSRVWRIVAVYGVLVVVVGIAGSRMMGFNLMDMFVVRVGETTYQHWEETIEYPKTLAAWETAKRHPVFGVGLGNATFHIKRVLAEKGFTGMAPVENPPNQFLTLLVETGVVGLTLFALFAGGTLVHIRRTLSTVGPGEGRDVAGAILAGAFSMTAVYAYMSWLSEPFLWFWLGLAQAGVVLASEENGATRPGDLRS